MTGATMPSSGTDAAAVRYRPDTADGMRNAAQLLVRQGLRLRDVAVALRISERAAAALIEEGARHE